MLELKLVKFADLNKYITCQIMHKLHSGLVLNVFDDYFTYNISVYDYNMCLSEGLHLSKLETIMGNEHCSRIVVC